MKKQFFMALIAGLLFCGSQAMAQKRATYQKEAIECLGVEGDGSQTVRVTGTGKNRRDAIEQAKKDAVAAVIFDGIRGGLQGCDTRPLIYEMNARRKYEDYFNVFFQDKGEYRNYVNTDDRRWGSTTGKRNKVIKNKRVTVTVLRPQLKQKLIADGIIKQQQ